MRTSRAGRLAAGALAVSVVLAACGGGDPAPAEDAGAADADASVVLSDFAISLEPAEAPTGSVTLAVTNDGDVAHALAVEGPDGEEATTPILDPGESADLVVTLPAEGAVLYCPVDGHRGQGMELRVHGAAGTDTGGSPAPSRY